MTLPRDYSAGEALAALRAYAREHHPDLGDLSALVPDRTATGAFLFRLRDDQGASCQVRFVDESGNALVTFRHGSSSDCQRVSIPVETLSRRVRERLSRQASTCTVGSPHS